MTIGEKIKMIRIEKGWSQKKLGEKSGINEVQIRKYERNSVNPKFENIKKIAGALDVSPIKLMELDKIENYIQEYELFINYLQSLGYHYSCEIENVIKRHFEDNIDENGNVIGKSEIIDEATYTMTLSKDGITAIFTDSEFQALQDKSRENIDGLILLQQQKNKKEPPPAATESDSE